MQIWLHGTFILRLSNHHDLPEQSFKLHLKFSKEVCKTKPAKVNKKLKNISHTPFFNYLFRRIIYISTQDILKDVETSA